MANPVSPQPKISWPLVLLAGLSFVPLFGFFLGSAAVSWGLLSSRPRARLAILLGGLGALFNVLGGLAAFYFMQGNIPDFAAARSRAVTMQLTEVVLGLERYHTEQHAYPKTLYDLQRQQGFRHPVNILDTGRSLLAVPQPLIYRVNGEASSYELLSVGSDGKEGTADDIHPTLPDSLRSKVGYRRAEQ